MHFAGWKIDFAQWKNNTRRLLSEKDFEEEEVLPNVITEADILSLVNAKIQECEITNQKTIAAILDVAANCKQIGGTDWEKAQNYVIRIVEDKMKSFGQKQKVKQSAKDKRATGRKEQLPEWFGKEDQQNATDQVQLNTASLEEERRRLEEELKIYQKA